MHRELDDMDMPRLTDIVWEGVSIIDGFCHAVYLGVDGHGIAFVTPVDAPWVGSPFLFRPTKTARAGESLSIM